MNYNYINVKSILNSALRALAMFGVSTGFSLMAFAQESENPAGCWLNGAEVPCDQLANSVNSWLGESLPVIIGIGLFGFLIVFLMLVGQWKMLTKANKPGWSQFIPIYNFIVMLEIANKPIWWILLMLIPFVNFVVILIVVNRLSQSFGHGVGFTLGLIFLPFIFFPILGFGSSRYIGFPDEPKA